MFASLTRQAVIRIAPFAIFMALLIARSLAPADGAWGFDPQWLYGVSVIASGTVLAIYGPFRYGGQYTSASNASFDEMLRARDPESGIREFEAVDQLARAAGFEFVADYPMPANNQTLIWRSSTP